MISAMKMQVRKASEENDLPRPAFDRAMPQISESKALVRIRNIVRSRGRVGVRGV